jgi:hypothetical protein
MSKSPKTTAKLSERSRNNRRSLLGQRLNNTNVYLTHNKGSYSTQSHVIAGH